jgi:2-polyprenyl-3-methyl-5-hydroxy-6-metoxy-1,4-benzoquinol methylase
MPLKIDPEGREIRALRRVTTWRGKRVLDVGCGDGRLSLRLAGLGADVLAIDPRPQLIRAARKSLPQKFAARIRYRVGSAERLPRRSGPFDVVVFSWTL